MTLTVAVQMDPIRAHQIAGDSTFALLLEAQRRGHRLFHYTPDRLSLRDGTVIAPRRADRGARREGRPLHARRAERDRPLRDSTWCCCARTRPSTWPTSPRRISSSASIPKTLVVNDPAEVRNAPEKIFVTDFPDLMPETLITATRTEIAAFREEFGDIIMKPLYGNGGAAVFQVGREDPNLGSLLDMFAPTFREPWIVQRFLQEVTRGRQAHHPDRRRAGWARSTACRPRTTSAPTWCAAARPKRPS